MLAEFSLSPWANEHPSSLLAIVVGFILLGLLLWFVNVPQFSRPFFRGLLNERAESIQRKHAQVDQAAAEIQQLRDDYASRLREIETESRKRIQDAVREADAAREEIIADAQNTARQVQLRTEEELNREQNRSRIQLRRQIVQISMDAAEKSVHANATESVQRALISDFITGAATASVNGRIITPNASPTQGGA